MRDAQLFIAIVAFVAVLVGLAHATTTARGSVWQLAMLFMPLNTASTDARRLAGRMSILTLGVGHRGCCAPRFCHVRASA